MANKTYCLATSPFNLHKPEDKIHARRFLEKEYPGIVYDSSTDSYEYRGFKFDYFKSGVGLKNTSQDTYLLVDKEDVRLWLSSYGNKEDRWKDYLKHKERQKQSIKQSIKQNNSWEKIKDILTFIVWIILISPIFFAIIFLWCIGKILSFISKDFESEPLSKVSKSVVNGDFLNK